jgi:hypothetical protein
VTYIDSLCIYFIGLAAVVFVLAMCQREGRKQRLNGLFTEGPTWPKLNNKTMKIRVQTKAAWDKIFTGLTEEEELLMLNSARLAAKALKRLSPKETADFIQELRDMAAPRDEKFVKEARKVALAASKKKTPKSVLQKYTVIAKPSKPDFSKLLKETPEENRRRRTERLGLEMAKQLKRLSTDSITLSKADIAEMANNTAKRK